MMGRSHLLSGAVTGLAVAALTDPPPALVPLIVAVAAYSALTPDLDHPAAPAARCLGPLSWVLCWTVRWLSARTTGRAHRGLSHSVLFAAAWALLVGTTTWATLSAPAALWLTLAAFLGCATHIAGDMLTLSGCQYVLWPSTVQVAVPYMLRFRTGGPAEQLVFAALVVSGVVLLPAAL